MPSDWRPRRIGEFAKRKKEVNEHGVDLPPLSVTKDRGVILQSEKYNKRVATDPRKYLIVRRGDFAFDPMSLYYGALGRVGRMEVGLISPDYVSFVVDGSVDPLFLEYLLRSPPMIRRYDTVAQQGNQHGKRRRVYWSVLAEQVVTLPPLPEQRKIAAILSSVDDAIERTALVVDECRLTARLLLDGILSRLGRTEEIDEDERGQWKSVALEHLLDGIDAGWSPLCGSEPAQPGEWGVLKVSSVSWGEFRPSENKRLPSTLAPRSDIEVRPGDLLVSRANTKTLVGRSVLVRETPPRLMISDKILRLRPRSGHVNAAFLNYVLGSRWCREQIEDRASGSSGSMKNISQGKLLGVLVPVPPLHLQERIAASLDAVGERVRREESLLAQLRKLRAGLLDELLSGRVRVPLAEQEAA